MSRELQSGEHGTDGCGSSGRYLAGIDFPPLSNRTWIMRYHRYLQFSMEVL